MGYKDNLYTEVIGHLYDAQEIKEDFYTITDVFLQFGMDISKPSISYNDYPPEEIENPLWWFAFPSNEVVLRTLKLLLDKGLQADDAAECWGHAFFDFVNINGSLEDDEEWGYEEFYDFIRKLMLIASYPHVLNTDADLRRMIWFDNNQYDVSKFRNWNDFTFEVDTSRCERFPEAHKSVVTIIEKRSGEPVWTFGVSLTPDDIK